MNPLSLPSLPFHELTIVPALQGSMLSTVTVVHLPSRKNWNSIGSSSRKDLLNTISLMNSFLSAITEMADKNQQSPTEPWITCFWENPDWLTRIQPPTSGLNLVMSTFSITYWCLLFQIANAIFCYKPFPGNTIISAIRVGKFCPLEEIARSRRACEKISTCPYVMSTSFRDW